MGPRGLCFPSGGACREQAKTVHAFLARCWVVIVIDWVCCSRHFVFFQLSIGLPLSFLFFIYYFPLCFSSHIHRHHTRDRP